MNRHSIELFEQTFQNHPELSCCRDSMEGALNILLGAFRRGNKLLICGNGGSAADAEHIVGELMKGFKSPRNLPDSAAARLTELFQQEGRELADKLQGALPAISLVSQSSLCSAIVNDIGADMVFAQQVYGYGIRGDVLWALSTSGKAKNVLWAVKAAEAFGLKTIGLTGKADNPLLRLCDVTIQVPALATEEVQEYHMRVYHKICAILEVELFQGD